MLSSTRILKTLRTPIISAAVFYRSCISTVINHPVALLVMGLVIQIELISPPRLSKLTDPLMLFNDVDDGISVISPEVTRDFIAKTLINLDEPRYGLNEKENLLMLEAITQIRQIDPMIKEYVDLAFTHLPILRFGKFDAATLRQLPHSERTQGAYFTKEMHILLTEDDLKAANIIRVLLEELRHAALNALHRTLKTASPFSGDICIPNTPSERLKIQGMIDACATKIHALKNLLIREFDPEAKAPLNSTERNYLATLRKDSNVVYKQYYWNAIHLRLNNTEFTNLNKALGQFIRKGQNYTIIDTKNNELFGPLHVIDIKSQKKYKKITIKMDDPLFALITHWENILQNTHFYDPSKTILEVEAHLNALVPQTLYAEFAGELQAYVNQWIRAAQAVAVDHKTMDAHTRFNHDLMTEMRNPEFFLRESAAEYFRVAAEAASKGDFSLAETAMPTLIKNNIYVTDAYAMLAVIAFDKKDYVTSVENFQKAEKHGAKLSPAHQDAYAKALANAIVATQELAPARARMR